MITARLKLRPFKAHAISRVFGKLFSWKWIASLFANGTDDADNTRL